MRRTRHLLALLALVLPVFAGCGPKDLSIALEDGEAVWGGHIKDGSLMPFAPGFETSLEYNLSNQVNPLLLTSKGQYVWSEAPFSFRIEENKIVITSHIAEIQTEKAGATLAEAFKAVGAEIEIK